MFRRLTQTLSIVFALFNIHVSAAAAQTHDVLNLDDMGAYAYSPPEWQTAICLPDDPCKSLVDHHGKLLYHYLPQSDRDFRVQVSVEVTGDSVWRKQELYSPRVPIVRTYRQSKGLDIVEETFAITNLPQGNASSRNDLVLVGVANTGEEAQTLHPKLTIHCKKPFEFRPEVQQVVINNHEIITSSLKMPSLDEGEAPRRVIRLDALTVPAGKTAQFFVCYSGGSSIVAGPTTVQQALACRDHAVKYWQDAPLPFGRVQVPDARIQALVDSSIRNVWQAREIKNGLPAFQVGPTCYRGLWIADGAFLLEAAAMLGAGKEARSGVAYELTFQQPDGGIKVMDNFSKEDGLVLWTCLRHARLTQDKAWLESIWPKLDRIAQHIRLLRKETLKNDSPLDDGLVPPGFGDGGIFGVQYEYTNVDWNLIGMKTFAEAAKWLGKETDAATWQREYDDFYAAFRKAAARDMTKDQHGNAYRPAVMGGAGKKELPQRSQWTFCHAVYPGQLFNRDDDFVAGNMAMLESTEREGMVYGAGWNESGLWTYFASFLGHAWLWQGEPRKAAELLYAFADHASPTLAWWEDQSLKGADFRPGGDMPHNWASAEFIRLVVHLLALDRGNELHLFEGLPAEWTKPGMVTKLDHVATPFGPLTIDLKVSANGKSADLHVEPMADPCCENLTVHLYGWASQDRTAVIKLDPKRAHDKTIPLSAP